MITSERTRDTLNKHITATITRLKRDQITGMSLANLRQITPTTGLTCTRAEYEEAFPIIAREVASRKRFTIL